MGPAKLQSERCGSREGKSHQREASQLANQSYNKPAFTSCDHLLHRRPPLCRSEDPALPSFLGCCVRSMYQWMTHSFQKGQSVLRGAPIQVTSHLLRKRQRGSVHKGPPREWDEVGSTLPHADPLSGLCCCQRPESRAPQQAHAGASVKFRHRAQSTNSDAGRN